MNKGPADRVAKGLLEVALLVSHKGEPPSRLGEDPELSQRLPYCSLRDIFPQEAAGGKGRERGRFAGAGICLNLRLMPLRKVGVFVCLCVVKGTKE